MFDNPCPIKSAIFDNHLIPVIPFSADSVSGQMQDMHNIENQLSIINQWPTIMNCRLMITYLQFC